jgi:hypothetical protein
MAEATIMLPVLILIWAIILYVHFAHRDQFRNLATLRNDAWSHAFGGCNSSPTDPTQFFEGDQFDGDGANNLGGAAEFMRVITSTLFMIDEFGAGRQVTVGRPRQLGGGTRDLRWDMLMLCNEDQRGDDQTPWYEMLFDFFSGA